MTVFDELKERGLLAQLTDEEEIKELINNNSYSLFVENDMGTVYLDKGICEYTVTHAIKNFGYGYVRFVKVGAENIFKDGFNGSILNAISGN